MDVLIVDDDDFALTVVENTLARLGYTAITARNGVEALKILHSSEVRLVITDWDMPEMNGVDFCRAVRREDLSGYVYVIMVTGREGSRQRLEGLYAGADDFLNKPLDPEELLVCLKTAERILSLETRDLALFALAKLAESRDSATGAHVERVQSCSRLIARNLSPEVKAQHGVDDDYIRLLHQTSALHDLGKVGIPDTILLKPGRLTPDEFTIMKTHTLVGAQTLDAALARFPSARFLQIAREIAATHHEKFDGSGYPLGLTGEQIPLCGRIVAVADVYDAVTSRRVYKQAVSHAQAMEIIRRGSGSHFDPEVVAAFERAEQQVIEVGNRLGEASEEASPEQLIVAVPDASEQSPASACAILVAEDDPVLRDQLGKLLGGTSQAVFLASNGEEAMALMAERNPRVVISDWVMPGIDGVELCRRIRSRGESDPVHFIMLTGNSKKSCLLEAYAAGVDDFVAKPFDAEELLARVRAGIRAARLHDDLVRKASGSRALNAQLTLMNSRLERLAITDELTGLFNRRHAMVRMEEQWDLSERYGNPLSVAMVDLDHFKSINDTRGHAVGDTILRRVASVLREQTRGTDAVCRIGGEEFLVIFPSQTVREAAIWAERSRSLIAASVFGVGGAELQLSVSIGLASRSAAMNEYPELLQAADHALYAAKSAGRNRVHLVEQAEILPVSPGDEPAAPASASKPPDVDSTPLPAPIDRRAILTRCGGDEKFAAAVTDRFRAQALTEVGKIQKAFAAGDADALRRSAHSLKSMSAYMSADSATHLASQIEDLAAENRLVASPALITKLNAEIQRVLQWLANDTERLAS